VRLPVALDRVHQLAKRMQRRFLLADYEDQRRWNRWLFRPGPLADRFEERIFPVRPDRESLRTVLVFKPDEIGDAVYALPAIQELRRHLPDARLLLLCRPLTRPLYERTGLFDGIAAFEPGSRSRLRHALDELDGEPVDAAVYLRTYPASFRDFRRVPARARVHPADPRLRSSSVYRARVSMWGDERLHQSLQMLEIVSLITGEGYGPDDVVYPEFQWTDEDRAGLDLVFADGVPDRFFVVHPFANDETRRYPAEYWARLLPSLQARLPGPWVVIGGPEDGGAPAADGLLQMQGRLSLGQTGYLLSRSSGFLGNLSGPAHWAAALGTPTVTLMSGHSAPVEWAPLGNSLVLRADVPCAPCHQRTCPVYGLACLTALRPELVEGEIADFLTRVASGPRASRQSHDDAAGNEGR
jgi:ADP-heptose:LPS heptosyltransferase